MIEIPTYVIVPVKTTAPQWWGFNKPIPYESVKVIPNTEGEQLNLSAKWNAGLDWAEKQAAEVNASLWNVAILNDDIEVAPDFLEHLAAGLRRNVMLLGVPGRTAAPTIAYVNCHGAEYDSVYRSDSFAGQTMAGWAFMVRGELGLRFDEQFRWWYGDSDFEMQVRRDGGVAVCVAESHARHLTPMESTRTNPELLQLAREDEQRFAAKWNIDPATLWLAMNPTWGAT